MEISLLTEFPYAILTAGVVLVGLHLANILYDGGLQHWLSRKMGHLAGAGGYVLCLYMFSSWHWPVILSASFLVLLFGARIIAPKTFRGVGGTGRPTAWAEIWYPLSGTAVLIWLWAFLDKAALAVTCVCFMGAGDAITGIVRSKFCTTPQKHWSGSIAMLGTCLLLAWCFASPLWLGVIAAGIAVITEWLCGDVGKIRFLDDNLAIPLVSAAVFTGGLYSLGLL